MTLKEVSRWSHEYLAADIAKGGKFVVFPYAISIIAVTYKRSSQIYYIPSYRMAITHGWMYSVRLVGYSLGTNLYHSIYSQGI